MAASSFFNADRFPSSLYYSGNPGDFADLSRRCDVLLVPSLRRRQTCSAGVSVLSRLTGVHEGGAHSPGLSRLLHVGIFPHYSASLGLVYVDSHTDESDGTVLGTALTGVARSDGIVTGIIEHRLSRNWRVHMQARTKNARRMSTKALGAAKAYSMGDLVLSLEYANNWCTARMQSTTAEGGKLAMGVLAAVFGGWCVGGEVLFSAPTLASAAVGVRHLQRSAHGFSQWSVDLAVLYQHLRICHARSLGSDVVVAASLYGNTNSMQTELALGFRWQPAALPYEVELGVSSKLGCSAAASYRWGSTTVKVFGNVAGDAKNEVGRSMDKHPAWGVAVEYRQ